MSTPEESQESEKFHQESDKCHQESDKRHQESDKCHQESEKSENYHQPQEPQISDDTIFVSIASYRDPECNNTLIDLFMKAKHPERVHVGICQQNAPGDADCLDEVLEPFADNIRVVRLSHFDAQGPMYARAIIEQSLYYGEMFYLQIDSHMLFVQDWDDICIRQLAMCPSERPILTTYPNDFDRVTRRHVLLPNGLKKPIGVVPPTFIRFREFHERLGFVEQEKENFQVEPQQPQPSLFWAAGFSFTLGELISEVPYDPNCPFLFVGEEMGLSMRYFTHGWDFFAPGVNIVYHLMKRTYRNTFWEQVYQKNCVVDDSTRMERKHREAFAVQRTRELVSGTLSPSDPYGLGLVRTIRDWEDYTGVSIHNKVASSRSYAGLSNVATPMEIFVKNIARNGRVGGRQQLPVNPQRLSKSRAIHNSGSGSRGNQTHRRKPPPFFANKQDV